MDDCSSLRKMSKRLGNEQKCTGMSLNSLPPHFTSGCKTKTSADGNVRRKRSIVFEHHFFSLPYENIAEAHPIRSLLSPEKTPPWRTGLGRYGCASRAPRIPSRSFIASLSIEGEKTHMSKTHTDRRAQFERTYRSILRGVGTIRSSTLQFAQDFAKKKVGCNEKETKRWSHSLSSDGTHFSPFGRTRK